MSLLPSLFNGDNSRTDPVRSLREMQKRMDRWFGDMFESSAWDIDNGSKLGKGFTPSCDVEETDSKYILNFDLPGVRKEDVKINIMNNVMTVSGERKEERENKNKSGYQSERFYGSFERSFTLPSHFKSEEIQANYYDGVLCVSVPKTEAAKSQQIKITDGKPTEKDRPGLVTEKTANRSDSLEDPEAQSRDDAKAV